MGLKIVGARLRLPSWPISAQSYYIKLHVGHRSDRCGSGPGYSAEFRSGCFDDRRRERLAHVAAGRVGLMVVCVEAGLGLDQALRVVSRELQIAHRIERGAFPLYRSKCGRALSRRVFQPSGAARTGRDEIKKLVAVLHSDRSIRNRGCGSLAGPTRDFHAVRRRQRPRKKGQQDWRSALIFPIFFLILPRHGRRGRSRLAHDFRPTVSE